MLIFKHEVLLSFVGRLIHDREFCEWFATQPGQALASHNLSVRDLEDLASVLQTERQQPEVSAALQPMVGLLLDLAADAGTDPEGTRAAVRLERLRAEIDIARQRVRETRMRRSRPWWKFWA